jgi:hypothetical protein
MLVPYLSGEMLPLLFPERVQIFFFDTGSGVKEWHGSKDEILPPGNKEA